MHRPLKKAENRSFAADENIQTWWRAAGNQPGEWISMDLGEVKDVRAVQINFADDKIDVPLPGERQGERYIDPSQHKTRWLLEASADGTNYFVLADKSDAETNLPHDFVVKEEGVQIRYLKLTVLKYRTIRIYASPASCLRTRQRRKTIRTAVSGRTNRNHGYAHHH